VSQPTLNRFYALHYLLPFVLILLVGLHIWAVHVVGQNNPAGIDVRAKEKTVPFTPYSLLRDIFAISVFLVFFAWFLFYMPNYIGHPDNYVQADPLKTSQHVRPEWYFLPFYAMLRAITFDIGPRGSVLNPWRRHCACRLGLVLLFADVVLLGWLGACPAGDDLYIVWSQIGTSFYFLFFLAVMTFLPRFERTHRLPVSIEEAMQRKKHGGVDDYRQQDSPFLCSNACWFWALVWSLPGWRDTAPLSAFRVADWTGVSTVRLAFMTGCSSIGA